MPIMRSLSHRPESILALLIHEFTETAEPVGSKRLVQKYQLDASPATVRGEMVELTEAGLLHQPHTSAGRVPTEAGYRYFVRRLLGDTELPADERRMIRHQFHQARAEVDEWVRLAASVLAHHLRVASLVTAPRPALAVFKHLELIATQGRQVLLVLVLQGGDVRQQILTLAEVVDQAYLSQLANQITQSCASMKAAGVSAHAEGLSGLAHEVTQLVSLLMARADTVSAGMIHHDGLANVLNQPEFANTEIARNALRLLEQRSLLDEVLAKALSPAVGGIQVVIGGEGAWDELKDYSMVLARYGAPGYATGALGVLGPTRMPYGRTISAVRYVAGLMSDLVIETFAG